MDFEAVLDEHCRVIQALKPLQGQMEALAARTVECLTAGGKVLWLGNGGSAADSQHLAAELVVRYRLNRRPLASIALTTDTSVLTAHANDFGYDTVFARQIEALARPGDLVMILSTSGNSPNVVLAAQAARQAGAYSVAWTGQDGGQLVPQVDEALKMPSRVTARIQEAHKLLGHYLCECLDARFAS